MTLIQLFFGFRGRLDRLRYGQAAAFSFVAFLALAYALSRLKGGGLPDGVVLPLYAAGFGLWIFVSVALAAKRWHDRGKSGWWTLIYLTPLVGPAWFWIETLFAPPRPGR